MRRIRYESNGGPEVLFTEEAPVPESGPGELLVRTEAIGSRCLSYEKRARPPNPTRSPADVLPCPGPATRGVSCCYIGFRDREAAHVTPPDSELRHYARRQTAPA